MVELKAITEDNFIDAFQLRLAPGQEKYVSHPIRSLAQAYVYRDQCQPFGIYAEEKMVGYVMVIYDYDVPEYDIWHMMIDEAEQGHGYGGEALDRVIEYIRTKPFGDSNRVALTCNKENPVARKLYESQGFSPTGNEDEDTETQAEAESAETQTTEHTPAPKAESAKAPELVAGCNVDEILAGLGGRENILTLDNCATRLRPELKDMSLVDEKRLKSAGAKGVMKPGGGSVQVVIGVKVQSVADALREKMKLS